MNSDQKEMPVIPGWPRYKCHKTVYAFKIHAVANIGRGEFMATGLNVQDGTFVFNGEWEKSQNPYIGGYVVRHDAGDYSYSSQKDFEEGYDPIPHSSQTSPDPAIPSNRAPITNTSKDAVTAIIEERGKVYGDAATGWSNIGLAWTSQIQQHFGIQLDHPIPNWLAVEMMVALKLQRGARGYHADSNLDANAYLKFSEDFQKPVS